MVASKQIYFIITSRLGLRLSGPPIDYTTCDGKIKQRLGMTSKVMLTKDNSDLNLSKGSFIRGLSMVCSRPKCGYDPSAEVVAKVLSSDTASLPALSFDLTL